MDHLSETIERQALADLQGAADASIRAMLGLQLHDSAAALVSVAGELPASAIVINRTLGLGLWQPATDSAVDEVISAYREAGVERFFVQIHPETSPPDLAARLEQAGLVKARGWQKFSRGTEAAPEIPTDLEIRRVGAEQGADFARIVCDAFDLGAEAEPWLAMLPGRPDWHVFMSFDGEQAAGTGALFVRNGLAWSDFGATAPAYRRRGSQGALLAARIDHAVGLGCERIFTCTGEDVAGDPQHSYRNIQKLGFEPVYVRQNYAPAA